MFRCLRQINLGLAVCLIVTACGTSKSSKDGYVEKKVEPLYNAAVNSIQAKEYSEAAAEFEEVERQHPYSLWAVKATLMAAYSHYQANQYDEALIAIDRYIRLHPGNRDVPYAYYLKALCYYEQISDVSRDQAMTEKALNSLEEIARRFPGSKYARDAELKIDLTRDHLAGKHMEIGRYYHDRGHYLAAINRFRLVVNNYETSTNVPEALHRLVEAYTALGIEDEARKAAAVLGHNYPGSDWYMDSYKVATGSDPRKQVQRKGFFARTWERLF